MKPFYSIKELADFLGDDVYSVADGLSAEGVVSYCRGKAADLSKWRRPIVDRGNGSIFITTGLSIVPDPATVIVSAAALPNLWVESIKRAESSDQFWQEQAVASDHDEELSNDSKPSKPVAAASTSLRGVTKQEILGVDNWHLPKNAPTMESILKKIPRWVDTACIKDGKAGAGAAGSHHWNPAQLAYCLATTSPQKKWKVSKNLLSSVISTWFGEYYDEWSKKKEEL